MTRSLASRALLAMAGVLAMVFVSARQARAIEVVDLNVPTIDLPFSKSAQTGSFEVTITSAMNPQPTLGDFQFTLTTETGLTLNGAGPDIFGGLGPTVTFGTNVLNVTDGAGSPPTLTPLTNLIQIDYSVVAGATGSFPITITELHNLSYLDNGSITPIPVSAFSGAVVIVPEPSSLVLVTIAGIALLAVRRFRRKD